MRAIQVRSRKGAALVEFAIVAMLLFILLFGIIEFSLLMKDYLTLNHAALEGARSASLGSRPSIVEARVMNDAQPLVLDAADIKLYKGSLDTDPKTWTDPLGDAPDGVYNDAGEGEGIRVSLTYSHPLVTGDLFGSLAGSDGGIGLSANMVMRRE